MKILLLLLSFVVCAASDWKVHPADNAAWKAMAAKRYDAAMAALPDLRKKLAVSSQSVIIGGIPSYRLSPDSVVKENRNRVLLHLHGGGFLYGKGESGTREALLMAAYGKFTIVSVDYRLLPEYPFPAALDDALAVYRELLKTTPAANIGVFGSSAGGNLVLALVLKARQEGLPLPGAIAPGTPWSDLSKTGDSYFALEGVDNSIGGYDGWVGDAAKLYANGLDFKNPLLSPVYADLAGFPPAFLCSGTRDLFLSNTVRVNQKLRKSGVETELEVYEGQSHAQYLADPFAPETRDHFQFLTEFLNKHLGR